jgi:hypothetical protein
MMVEPVYKDGKLVNGYKLKQDLIEKAHTAGHTLIWSKARAAKGNVPDPDYPETGLCTLCGEEIQATGDISDHCNRALFNRLDDNTKARIARQMKEQ